MNYKITKIERETNRFVVEAEFYDKNKKVETINHAFPLEMTEKEIENEIAKSCKTFQLEKEQAVKQAVLDEQQEKADKIIKNLTNKEGKI